MAVGMNIDIASIDMVSEVNMVSTEVYGWVAANLHLGMQGEKVVSQWERGVSDHMCEVGVRAGHFTLESIVFVVSEPALSGP